MLHLLTKPLPLITLLCTITACSPQPKRPTLEQLAEQNYPKIALIGDFPAKIVYGMPDELPPTLSEPLQISVPVKLLADDPIAIQFRYIFLDASDRPIDPPMKWRERTLLPRINTQLDAIAPNQKARDWKLEIKPAPLPYQ